MIQTRSPYYYNVVFPNTNVTSIDFTISIGVGTTSVIVVEDTYSITKPNPSAATLNTWIDISPYIRDSYIYDPMVFTGIATNTIVASGAHSVLLATVGSHVNDTIGSNEEDGLQKFTCTDGYGYYTEGQNPQPTKKILLSHDEYKADSRGYFVIPLRAQAGDGNPTVNGVESTLSFTNDVTNYVKYLIIPCANYTGIVTVAFEGEEITIEIVSECKYPLTEIQFLNRYGVFEVIHFYKASKESLDVKTDTFKNAYTNGVSYDVAIHQNKTINVTSNRKINIESGFLNESYNDTMQELMQSEYVWKGGKPINLKGGNFNFKTRIVDKLISYSVDFEYAYDEINNV